MSRVKSALALLKEYIKMFRVRYSRDYHEKVVSTYWENAPATHRNAEEQHFVFYATEIDKVIRRYIGDGEKLILDHGAGEGSIALHLSKLGYRVAASEKFEQYRTTLREKGLSVFDSENLPENQFDAIIMNGAFYYIHPSLWKSEINRLLLSLKNGGYLFLTDVPTIQKMHLLKYGYTGLKKSLDVFVSRLTGVYQPTLGGFFVDEKIIKKWYPQTIVEDEWCYYRSHFIIKKSLP